MSDVYSFGVVLLELLTGRRSMDKKRPLREQNLVEWAKPYLNDARKLDRIMDPKLDGQYSVKGAQKAAQLAYQCLRDNPKARPPMCAVVKTLELVQGFDDIPAGPLVYSAAQSPTKDKPEAKPAKDEEGKNGATNEVETKVADEEGKGHLQEVQKKEEGTEAKEAQREARKQEDEEGEEKNHRHRRRHGHRHRSTISPHHSENSLYKYFNNASNSPNRQSYRAAKKEAVLRRNISTAHSDTSLDNYFANGLNSSRNSNPSV